jgi:hypothetical protein
MTDRLPGVGRSPQASSVMRSFLANPCFCLTFPFPSEFSSRQRSSSASAHRRCDKSLLPRRNGKQIARGDPPNMASLWKDGGTEGRTRRACLLGVTHYSKWGAPAR